MATYAELIDDFELEKRIRTIPEDMDLTEYIKQRGGVDYPEEKADGGTIGIEVLFEKKKNGGRIGFQGGGMDASKSDFKSPSSRTYSRSYNPGAGGVVQHSGGGSQSNQGGDDKPSFKEKVKSVVTNPAVQLLGGAVLTGGINLAFPGALEKLNKARMISNAIKYGKDIAIEDEIESIPQTGGISSPYADGGRVGFNMGGAQFTSGGNISPGTDKRGNIRDDNPFTGGGGGGDGPKGPPVIINPPPTKDKSTELLTFDEYTGKPMTYADVAAANKFLNFVQTQGGYTMGEDPEADALFNAYQTATGRDTFMQDATVDSVTNMRTTDIDGDTKSFFDQTSTITDNPTGKMTKSLVVDTPTSFTQRFTTPTGIMENDVPQKFGAPQSLSVDPYSKNIIGSELKDGGRVGLFMGGDPLTGQALAIYNSMKAYGEEDQAIADKLQSLGYYDPNASTPSPAVPRKQISQGRGNDQDTTYVDRQDYSFNPANYAPGGQLEINPAAFGMSFEKASKPQGIINAALEMPGRTLTSFASPTTGGNITGPAEEGFMSQVVDIDPVGRTREQLRQQYESYNRFFGAPSNYAAARTRGKAGQVLGTIAGAAAGVPFVGPAIDILSKMGGGDKGLQSKYTVDNVGFGNTGARDEFGLATFDRKDGLFGLTGNTTRDYADRMKERLGELDDFFGSRIEGFDINNLDAATLNEMSKINSFYTKQIQAYKQRLAVEDINKNTQDAIKAQEEAKKKEEAAFQAQLNETQRQQRMSDLQRIERAYREETGGRAGSYGTGESGIQRDSAGREVGYNDPFDPGGGEKDGGFIDGYNRRKYSNGGLATMFTRRR